MSNYFRQTFENCNSRINSLELKITNIENSITNNIQTSIQNLSTDINDIRSMVQNIPKRINRNENPFRSITTLINNIRDPIQTISTNVSTIMSNVQRIPQKLDDNQNTFQSITNDFSNITRLINNIMDPIQTIFTNVSTIISNVQRIPQKLNDNQNTFRSIINEELNTSISRLILFNNFLIQYNNKSPINFIQGEKDDGLFSFFISFKGNPFKFSNWEITSNSEEGYENVLKNICEKDNDLVFKTKDERNSYIKIYFGGCFFNFSSICLWDSDEDTLDRYIIQQSNNGRRWTRINLTDCEERDTYIESNSESDSRFGGFYKYLKIKMIGKNKSNNNRISLKRIELYGTLKLS